MQTAPATPGASTGDSESDESAPSSGTAAATAHPKPRINPFVAIGLLALLGLASPFLELQEPMHGAIGLFILFIGLRIAWQLTASAPLDVEGPYTAAVVG